MVRARRLLQTLLGWCLVAVVAVVVPDGGVVAGGGAGGVPSADGEVGRAVAGVDVEVAPGDPGVVEAVGPVRLVETRPGQVTVDGLFEGGGRLGAGETLAFAVAGRAGVPVDVSGVVLNVTAVAPSGSGFLTVFPCGGTRPVASSSNYVAGDTVANMVMAKVGIAGEVCVFSFSDTDLVVDLNGVVPAGGQPETVDPVRLVETRPGQVTVDGSFEGGGRLGAGETLAFAVAGRAGVPVDVSGVVLNVTAVAPSGSGFLTVFPCGGTRPVASSSNYVAGDTVANTVMAEVGVAGEVCVYSDAETHLVVDLNAVVASNQGVYPRSPVRLLDTRESSAPVRTSWDGGPLAAGSTVRLDVARYPGAEILGDAFLTVTAVRPDARGYLTVYPCGHERPLASNLNYRVGDIVANSVYAEPGYWAYRDEAVCIYTHAATHLVVDLDGYANGSVPRFTLYDASCDSFVFPMCDDVFAGWPYTDVPDLWDTIPAWVFDAAELEELVFVADVEFPTLPPEIGQLDGLTTLVIGPWDLGQSKLAVLPPDLGALVELTTLDLGGNRLISLPKEVGNLTRLTTLALDRNRLTSLPAELGNLTRLTVLDASGNDLGTIPVEIGDLTNLDRLDLGGNEIVGDITAPMKMLRLTNPTVDLTIGGRGCPTIDDPDTLAWVEGKDPFWNIGCA